MVEATATSDWRNDTEYEEVAIGEVRREGTSYALKRADGWTLGIDDPGFVPQPGQLARFYGLGIGSPVRGVVIEGRVCYYRTAEEDKQHWKDRTYPRTAAEALKRWDAGDSLFTIEMGGLGPGYEQCIHVLAFEIIRDALATNVAIDDKTFDKATDSTVARVDQHLGLSGAQVGAAKHIAFRTLRDGWQTWVLSYPDDRRIQVSKHWPHLPETPSDNGAV